MLFSLPFLAFLPIKRYYGMSMSLEERSEAYRPQQDVHLCIAPFYAQHYEVRALVRTGSEVWMPRRSTTSIHGTRGSQVLEHVLFSPYLTRTLQHLPIREGIGLADASYYPRDDTIVLWHCELDGGHRASENPVVDDGLALVMDGVELHLFERFPQASRIVVPTVLSSYPREAWERFLKVSGYSALNAVALEKRRVGP